MQELTAVLGAIVLGLTVFAVLACGVANHHCVAQQLHLGAIVIGQTPIGGGRGDDAVRINGANPNAVNFQPFGVREVPRPVAPDFAVQLTIGIVGLDGKTFHEIVGRVAPGCHRRAGGFCARCGAHHPIGGQRQCAQADQRQVQKEILPGISQQGARIFHGCVYPSSSAA